MRATFPARRVIRFLVMRLSTLPVLNHPILAVDRRINQRLKRSTPLLNCIERLEAGAGVAGCRSSKVKPPTVSLLLAFVDCRGCLAVSQREGPTQSHRICSDQMMRSMVAELAIAWLLASCVEICEMAHQAAIRTRRRGTSKRLDVRNQLISGFQLTLFWMAASCRSGGAPARIAR